MYFRRKCRGCKALHTIPLLFAHRFAKAEAMIIIANYYTCSSQAGHWCWIRVRASKRYVWAQHRLNREVPVAAAGRDRGLLHLHADCVHSCSPDWTKCPAVFRSSRAIPDICVTGPPRPLFAATSLIPAAVTPQQIFKQTRHIPNEDTHTHTLHFHHTFNTGVSRGWGSSATLQSDATTSYMGTLPRCWHVHCCSPMNL